MQKTRSFSMVLCAFFTALLAVFSQIAFPLGPVPVNLSTLAIYAAAAVLGGKWAALSAILWALLGAVGVPVFSLFRGGLSTLTGPTGGFILGFIPMAFVTGSLLQVFSKSDALKKKTLFQIFSMIAGLVLCFAFGTVWYQYVAHVSFSQSLVVCVLPFLPGEVIKLLLGLLVIHRLTPLLSNKAT